MEGQKRAKSSFCIIGLLKWEQHNSEIVFFSTLAENQKGFMDICNGNANSVGLDFCHTKHFAWLQKKFCLFI